MKKDDFKDIFNPKFLETVNKFIENKIDRNLYCSDCPFYIINSTENKLCHETYRNKINGCFKNDEKLTESAKAFKTMVEEEKEKQFLEGFFHGKFENGVLKVMGGAPSTEFSFKEINILTKEIIENTDKKLNGGNMEEFKVGDRVKIVKSSWGNESLVGLKIKIELIEKSSVIFMLEGKPVCISIDDIEKIEDKPQTEPFELKKGMKVKFVKKGLNDYYSEKIMKADKVLLDCIVVSGIHIKNEYIDWEATKKLNEVKEEPKKETKPKEYMIFNPKGNAPRKIHNSLESAEKEVIRLLNIQSNQEFYVVEIVKKAKGSITVSWSE